MSAPAGWRFLQDTEPFEPQDLAWGRLANGTTGWGRIPPYWVGQAFCEGWALHPDFVIRRTTPQPPGGPHAV